MRSRKPLIAKFVFGATMACFLTTSQPLQMRAMAAEVNSQMVEDIVMADAVPGMETDTDNQEKELGNPVEELPEQSICEGNGEEFTAPVGVSSVYYTFPYGFFYDFPDVRGAAYKKAFTGDNGRYSVFVFGGIGSSSSTNSAVKSMLTVADSDGTEELDIYLVDTMQNSAESIADYIGNSVAAKKLLVTTRDDIYADSFYRTCYYATIGSGNSYTIPLIVYVNPKGELVSYSTGSAGTGLTDIINNLVQMGLKVARKYSNVEVHTPAEIKAFVNAHPASMSEKITYATEPVTSGNFAPGALSAQTLYNGLNALNQVRYIAGLDANITLNTTYNEKCQAGMLVDYVLGKLTHYPDQPAGMSDDLYNLGYAGTSSSNIYWCSAPRVNLAEATFFGWMEDGDASNIDRLGHRRWILNPGMGQTGFGAVTGTKGVYSAMYSIDRSGKGNQYGIMWPAQNMPKEYFDSFMPWSFSTGDQEVLTSVKVTLKRVSDGKIWNFSSTGADGYFNVDNGGYGQKGCIIFRPSNVGGYDEGDVFEVSITGLASGAASYKVSFFSLSTPEPAIAITTQPTDQTVTAGQQATFKVAASGTGLTYQWRVRKDGNSAWNTPTAASAKTNTYTLTTKDSMNGYQIICVVTDENGNQVNSNVVKLTVKAAPITITTQPTSQTVAVGQKVSFKVAASGSNLNYQWKVRADSNSKWTTPTAASAKTNTYTLTAKDSLNGYQIACVITDANGNKLNSSIVKLTVKAAAITVTTQPTDQTVTAGQKVSFKVAASGSGLTYQWKVRKDSNSGWTTPTAASAKTNTYTFTAKASLNGYQVACVITDQNGNKVNSNIAKLTVK